MSVTHYVVLHHTGFGEPHYDLMVESARGASLTTWRCSNWPIVAGDILTQIGDHRREYLDYEGPVSGNRGEVRRVAKGDCTIFSSKSQVTIQLIGPNRSMMILSHARDDRWSVVEVDP
jgi:hypothetical protein